VRTARTVLSLIAPTTPTEANFPKRTPERSSPMAGV